MDSRDSVFLPNEMLNHIASFTDDTTLGRFSRACKFTHGLFKNQLTGRQIVKLLLKSVMAGDSDTAEKLLLEFQITQPNVCLVTLRTTGKEPNGREWEKPISPLEFATWAGDVTDNDDSPGMVNRLLKYVPSEKKQEALEQMKTVREHGTEHGKVLAFFYEFLEAGKAGNINFDRLGSQLTNFDLQWFYDWVDILRVLIRTQLATDLLDTGFNRAPRRKLLFDVYLLITPEQAIKTLSEIVDLGEPVRFVKDYQDLFEFHDTEEQQRLNAWDSMKMICCSSTESLDAQILKLQETVENKLSASPSKMTMGS